MLFLMPAKSAKSKKKCATMDCSAEYPIVGVAANTTAFTHAGGKKIIVAFLESRGALPMSWSTKFDATKHTAPEQICTVAFIHGISDFIAGRVKSQGGKHKYASGSCLQHLGAVRKVLAHTFIHTHTGTHAHRHTAHVHIHTHAHTHTHTFRLWRNTVGRSRSTIAIPVCSWHAATNPRSPRGAS